MKEKKHINFKAIGLSLIFLFNPNINIIDVLPDFIGYILLYVTLTNLADLNETVAGARATFQKLIFIDASKLLALMWVFGISVATERNASLLLWSFIFGALELLFAVPAFIKLFRGIGELGYLYENTSVYGNRGKGKRSYNDRIRSFTVLFISLKAVLSFLPELSDLTSTEYYENHGMTSLYEHIGIMRVFAFIPVLVVGVIWIIRCVSYFLKLNADIGFVDGVERDYRAKILNKEGIFVKRNVKLSFALLFLAVLFSFDLRIEYVNVLPDFISAGLMLAFFLTVSRRSEIDKKLSVIAASSYIVTSVAATVTEFLFFKNYYYAAIYRSEEAMAAYIVMLVFACVNVATFALNTVFAAKAIGQIINEHTGAIAISETGSAEARRKMTDSIRAELKTTLLYMLIGIAVYLATDVSYLFLAKDYGFMLMINVVGIVLAVSMVLKAYLNVFEAVESRYILE